MKLISWNVNGLRAVLKKGFEEFFNEVDADIFCIQETKCQPNQVELEFEGYKSYWNSAQKKGYSGTAIFKTQEINVQELINNVIQNLAIPLDIKQQNIIANTNNKNVFFIGDYNWQLEAITNIVKNCIEHTPENKNIYISYEQNNFYTKIVIQDEGCGINSKDIKHIFERFYKGQNSSSDSVGIGLALAKSIIERDNGYIICSSENEKGTKFEIKYYRFKIDMSHEN